MTNQYFITWDLGGTKCAAGLVEYHANTAELRLLKRHSILLHQADSLQDLAMQIENGLGCKASDMDAVCVGAAGQYDGEKLTLAAGYPFAMPIAELARHTSWANYAVIHDYATMMCATFTSYLSSREHVKLLNGATIDPYARRVTFGVGTGLGVKDGVLFPNGDFWLGLNEMGHIALPSYCHDGADETMQLARDLHAFLQKRHQTNGITFEHVLSGPGFAALYEFLYPDRLLVSPSEIGQLMLDRQLPELVNTFAWYLGVFVATLQLSFMPAGGIWMTGGVLLKHLEVLEKSMFVAGMRSLKAYLPERMQYPLGVLYHDALALIGAGFYAARRLAVGARRGAGYARMVSK